MKSLWPPLLLWLALCLGGSAWCAWSFQSGLQTTARSRLLAQQEKFATGTTFTVNAHGRSLELSGTAFRQSDIALATRSLTEDLRVPGLLDFGQQFNPVLSTKDSTHFESKPTGWGVLIASSTQVRLHGKAGSEFESTRIATALQSAAPDLRSIDNRLIIDAEQWVESDTLDLTLGKIGNLPPLSDLRLQQGLIAVTRWGQPWQLIDIEKPVESLRKELVAAGMSENAWHEGISADVDRLRDFHAAWLSAQRESGRLAKLPPGHLVLAQRGDAVLLRGELGDEQSISLVTTAITKLAGTRRVIDEIIRSPHRRPEPDVRPLVHSLPTLASGMLAKYLAIGSAAKGWTELKVNSLDMLDEASVAAQVKPTALDPRLIMPDMLAAVAWLNSINDAPIRIDGAKRLPHLLLIAVGERVLLRGAVADESTRSQVESSTRKLYLTRSIDSAIRLDTSCAAMNGVLHTITSLPDLPALNTTGLIAVAIPGDTWHSKILRSDLIDSDGLEKSGLLPEGLTVAQVMPDVLDVADTLKAHLAKVRSAPRGIPLQAP